MITVEEDRQLRAYAKRINPEVGEDAYHVAVISVLKRPPQNIRNVVGFFKVCMRMALMKIYRHEKAERSNIQAFINNDPIPMMKGFVPGDTPHDTCRRGHVWSEKTICYIGGRRTCRICKNVREAKASREKYHRMKEQREVAA